jgi:hypothetical protein
LGRDTTGFAVNLILENLNLLNGKFSGASNGAKSKQKTWQEISDQFKALV